MVRYWVQQTCHPTCSFFIYFLSLTLFRSNCFCLFFSKHVMYFILLKANLTARTKIYQAREIRFCDVQSFLCPVSTLSLSPARLIPRDTREAVHDQVPGVMTAKKALVIRHVTLSYDFLIRGIMHKCSLLHHRFLCVSFISSYLFML